MEDIPHETLKAALDRNYQATSDLGDLVGFDVAVITVPTPLRDGAPDLSYVAAAGEQLTRVLRAGALIILESTTYPGTTEELLRPILERSGLRAGVDFFLGYSPERIDPGNKTWNFVNTPKVVSGIDAGSLQAVSAFYASLVDRVVEVESAATAELVKILENTYRHVNIALVNELAMFAKELGVDVWAAIDAAASKPFGFTAFRPGPGVGGHCLPIDPSYLSWRVRQNLGHTFRFVELANDVNDHMPDYVVSRIGLLLNDHQRSVKGTRILLLGLTYKAGTSDWRESPSLADRPPAGVAGRRAAAVRPPPGRGGPAQPARHAGRPDGRGAGRRRPGGGAGGPSRVRPGAHRRPRPAGVRRQGPAPGADLHRRAALILPCPCSRGWRPAQSDGAAPWPCDFDACRCDCS